MSIKPETAKRLHDVSVAGHELMEFCADRTREDLDSDLTGCSSLWFND